MFEQHAIDQDGDKASLTKKDLETFLLSVFANSVSGALAGVLIRPYSAPFLHSSQLVS